MEKLREPEPEVKLGYLISIIVVNYNNSALTIECISRTIKALPENVFEIIVVDNASSDESFSMLVTYCSEQKQIECVRAPRNGGFGYGNNVGAVHASSEILWFLNSDAWVVSVEGLSRALRLLEDPNTGMVGTAVILQTGDEAPHGGVRLSFWNIVLSSFRLGALYRHAPAQFRKIARVFLERVPGQIGSYIKSYQHAIEGEPIKTESVGGSSFLITKTAYKKVGGFDERFFLYDEDVDLCARLGKEGYAHWIEPLIKVECILHGTTSKVSRLVLKKIKRDSRIRLIRGHFSGVKRALLIGITYASWRLR